MRIDYKRENIKLDVNHNLIRAYVQLMSEIKSAYPVQGDLSLDMITRLPGLVTVSSSDLSAEELDLIGRTLGEATDTAIQQLKQMRITEGRSLMDGYRSPHRQYRPPSGNDPRTCQRTSLIITASS